MHAVFARVQLIVNTRGLTIINAVVTKNPYYDDSGDETPYEDL